ncbi:MAG: MATE family efflux transporter [Methylobacterium sp.]|nr:MAG: MATE family efflux transporter [Methylobacterium sp.]
MSATGSIGLMAVFVVDLLSLLYVSKLGDTNLTAAVGFAAIVQFFAIAINIGLMIAAGALVSRAIGAGDGAGARRIATSATLLGIAASALLVALLLPLSEPLLRAIGAEGETLRVAERFLWIALPSNVLMAPGMMFSGLLRAVGAARQAMFVTLGGALVTVGLDPLLIFGAGLGVDGAAITTCVARATFALIGWHGVRQHRMLAPASLAATVADAPLVFRIALPAVLTNLAPSVASAFLAHVLARGPLMRLFALDGVAADLFGFFCLVSGGVWFFNGLLFLANAAFNNLGFPFRSTLLNWGRATLGTMPPALAGAALYGPRGVLAGVGIGSLAFGLAGILMAARTVTLLERDVVVPARAPDPEASVAAGPAHGGALV